ncbi:hypothetical protein L0128_21795 [candidate division KSB1 bacterium]|nr:hypothetical protein [candidate division KSB1 bacterium]
MKQRKESPEKRQKLTGHQPAASNAGTATISKWGTAICALLTSIITIFMLILELGAKLSNYTGLDSNKVLLGIIGTFLVLLISLAWYQWRRRWLLFLYIIPILTLGLLGWRYLQKMDKFSLPEPIPTVPGPVTVGEKEILVFIPNFESPVMAEGAKFADRFYNQLKNKLEYPIEIGTHDSVTIRIQRINAVLNKTDLRSQRQISHASLGVLGKYRIYQEHGLKKEQIEEYQVVFLEARVASIFREPKPFGEFYEFMLNFEDIKVDHNDVVSPEEIASYGVEYVVNMAGNARLLEHAAKEKGWDQNEILHQLHTRLESLGKLIHNPSLAYFHAGNSYLRAAKEPYLNAKEKSILYKNAIAAYQVSIDSLWTIPSNCLLKHSRPERPYLNLIYTYQKLDSVTAFTAPNSIPQVFAIFDTAIGHLRDGSFNDVISQAEAAPLRILLEEAYKFSDEQCQQAFVKQKNPNEMVACQHVFDKFIAYAEILENEIRTSKFPILATDMDFLLQIEEERKFITAHFNKLKKMIDKKMMS